MKHQASLLAVALLSPLAHALEDARVETGADQVHEQYGLTGKGVTVAVIDRGISWRHPDFINPDGTTRIKRMLDMSNQSLCNANNPAPVEYTEAQINQALANDTDLGSRDTQGHGSATAGTAAGNGRALGDLRHMGIAPEADIIVARVTTVGEPAHGAYPAAPAFQGCYDDAFEWAAQVIDELGQPGVAILNIGTQWGPMDGSSALSRKMNETFPPDHPGRILVLPSGDEGSLPSHARAEYDASGETVITLERQATTFSAVTAWFSGDVPAEVTIEFDDGTSVGPVRTGQNVNQDGVNIVMYSPGQEFYPWRSDSGDYAMWSGITGHATTGRFIIRALNASDGIGTVDVYTDVAGPGLTTITHLTSHLAPGRLSDVGATRDAIIVGDYNLKNDWVDLNGVARSAPQDGLVDDLWVKSSGGPTRDGRSPGVDLAAPGQGLFAPVGLDSYWSTLDAVLEQGSGRRYIRFGGASAAAPLVTGTVALMLQVHPTMTTRQAREILRNTAREDAFTGDLPNDDWGYGKLDTLAAVEMAMAHSRSGAWYNPAQSGHGWFVESRENLAGEREMTAYWYVYLDGKPVWLLALGTLEGSTATMTAYITENGDFPPDFNGADVLEWGTLELEFEPGTTGVARWTTSYPGFSSGSTPITQLSRVSGRPEACVSGSWYNRTQSGHGFVVEVIPQGDELGVLVTWYVYRDGEQVWLLGQGTLVNGVATLAMRSFSGADFPPDFLAADVAPVNWGTLELEVQGPNSLVAKWTPVEAGYTAGELQLERLTRLSGHHCPE